MFEKSISGVVFQIALLFNKLIFHTFVLCHSQQMTRSDSNLIINLINETPEVYYFEIKSWL